MNYKNNKLSLNKISQDFRFKVKFGLVLIYILKVYCKKSSSILLRKNIFNSFFFSFEKHVPSQISKDFSNENIKTAPSTFLKKIWSEIFFYLYIPLHKLKISQDRMEGRGNHQFSCFPLPPAHEHLFSPSIFLPLLFHRSICHYQTHRRLVLAWLAWWNWNWLLWSNFFIIW